MPISGFCREPEPEPEPEPEQPISGRAGEPVVSPVPVSIALVAFLLVGTLAAFGAPHPEVRVMVPFTELSKVMGPEESMVIVPEADYRYLLDVGEKPTPEPIRSPINFSTRRAEYKGTIGERGVKFRGHFEIELFNEGWKTIRLLSSMVIPSQVSLDGSPAPLDLVTAQDSGESHYGLITNGTGSRVLDVDFFLPFSATEFNTRRFELPMVPFCLSTLEILVPEGDCDAWLDPGILTVVASGPRGTTFRAILPPTSRVKVELARRLGMSSPAAVTDEQGEAESASGSATAAASAPVVLHEETRVLVTEKNLLMFEEGFVQGRNQYVLQVMGSEGISSFTLRVPPQIRVLKVEDRTIDDWKIEEVADEKFRRLNIAFNSEVKGVVGFAVEFEEDIQRLKENELYLVPEMIPVNADRSTGLLAVGCLPSFEVGAPETLVGYSVIDVGEFLRDYKGQPPEKLPLAFKFIKHPNKLQLSLTRPKAVDQVSAVVDRAEAMTLVNEDGFLLTRVAFEVRNNSEQFLKIRLPELGSVTTTLWSSEVANLAVKAGFDPEKKVFNIPIIRSPMVNGDPQPFPVEIIFAMRLAGPLRSFQALRLELPRVHLDVSELSWVAFLPEGFELMRGEGNVDRIMDRPDQPLLDGRKQFPGLDLGALMTTKTQSVLGGDVGGSSVVGLLPVKFMIPTTSWSTSFLMQQIEPNGEPPHMAGVLVSPRSGQGKMFQVGIVLCGALAGISLLFMFTGRYRFFWFTVVALLSAGLAFTLMMKLYQADNSFKMGFLATFITCLMFHLFRWKPTESIPAGESPSGSTPTGTTPA